MSVFKINNAIFYVTQTEMMKSSFCASSADLFTPGPPFTNMV